MLLHLLISSLVLLLQPAENHLRRPLRSESERHSLAPLRQWVGSNIHELDLCTHHVVRTGIGHHEPAAECDLSLLRHLSHVVAEFFARQMRLPRKPRTDHRMEILRRRWMPTQRTTRFSPPLNRTVGPRAVPETVPPFSPPVRSLITTGIVIASGTPCLHGTRWIDWVCRRDRR